MKEVFYEESSFKIKKNSDKVLYFVLKALSIVLFFFAFIWIISNVTSISFSSDKTLATILFVFLPTVLSVVSGVFLIKLSSTFDVDYDYTFVSGTIRIAKVIMDSKRIPIIMFDSSDIDVIGRVGSSTYNRLVVEQGLRVEYVTAKTVADENKSFFYILFYHEGEKKALILECTDTFIKTILNYENKRLLEEEFNKWYILITQPQLNLV